MKIAKDIEELLSWAYLEELPKSQSESNQEAVWRRLERYGSLGGIDVDHGLLLRAPDGDPHPDAKVIGAAVTKLGKVSIAEHIDIIAGDLRALVNINDFLPRKKAVVPGKATEAGYYDPEGAPPFVARRRDVLALSTIDVAALIVRHARLGTHPEWMAGQPQPCAIPGRRGPKLIGECKAKNYYTTGSYCPIEWSPSPLQIILGRADYHLWYQSLVALSQTLALADFDVRPPVAPATPWTEGEKKHRVFSYAVAPQEFYPLKPQRDWPGPPLRKFKRNKGRGVEVD